MKKQLVVAVILLLALAIAVPASAEVQFKYGGIMRVRFLSQFNIDPQDYVTGNGTDAKYSSNYFDQRTRLYFTFIASENLKLVTKFEMGNYAWGRNNGSGRMGADTATVKVKNSYLDFNIPCTPTKALVGIQSIALLDSWIVDDDYAAALFVTKLDPFTITVGYISGSAEPGFSSSDPSGNFTLYNEWRNRVDDYVISVDYKSGPYAATLLGIGQFAHNTPLGAVPWTLVNPVPFVVPFVGGSLGAGEPTANRAGFVDFFPGTVFADYRVLRIRENNLFNIGGNFTYKTDWISAYIQGVKNLGNFKYDRNNPVTGLNYTTDASYTGWMIDAGVNVFYGPYTFNLTGFYTSGPKKISNTNFASVNDIDWFTYAGTTSKYFSEIIGGGILDNQAPSDVLTGDHLWRGYGYPTNLWTISVGGAWQVLPDTKLAASYWYFGTSTSVASTQRLDGSFNTSSSIGHELNFYLTQGIVDGLTLDLVAAYLITGDAYKKVFIGEKSDDVYELGARLQWAF